jgi:hypothetical protein
VEIDECITSQRDVGREEVVLEPYSGDETMEIAAEIQGENGRGKG